jgi:hypothetical protein
MNAERNNDWNRYDNLSPIQQHEGSIPPVASGPSKLFNAIVSDPIFRDGIFRFSVTSQRRHA